MSQQAGFKTSSTKLTSVSLQLEYLLWTKQQLHCRLGTFGYTNVSFGFVYVVTVLAYHLLNPLFSGNTGASTGTIPTQIGLLSALNNLYFNRVSICFQPHVSFLLKYLRLLLKLAINFRKSGLPNNNDASSEPNINAVSSEQS